MDGLSPEKFTLILRDHGPELEEVIQLETAQVVVHRNEERVSRPGTCGLLG